MGAMVGDARRVSFSGAGSYSFWIFVTGLILIALAIFFALVFGSEGLGPVVFVGALGLAAAVQWPVIRGVTLRTVDFDSRLILLPGMRVPFDAVRALRLDSRIQRAHGTELAHGRPGTAGFAVRFEQWEIVLELEDADSVALVRSHRLPGMVVLGRSLAERLGVPFVHEAPTVGSEQLSAEAGAGGGTTPVTPERLEVLPGAPASPRVRVEGESLLVESRGKGWFRFGYSLFVGAVGIVGVFGMYEVEKRPVSEPFGAGQWACTAFAGLCFLGSIVQLVFILLGENRKLIRVDRRGVHATTARRGARATTIPLDRVAAVQTENQTAGADEFTHLAVVVGTDGETIRILCDSVDGAQWMTGQIRAAIKATRRAT